LSCFRCWSPVGWLLLLCLGQPKSISIYTS
jgi:hypothetical protein